MTTTTNESAQGAVPLIGRILLAVIFILSSVSKLANPAGTQGYIASVGLPLPLLAYIVAVVVEIAGGVLLLVGYRTRLAAAALAVFTVAAAVVFHHAFGDQNQFIHFMKNIAITGGLLQVFAFGAGAFSVDNRRAAAPAHKLVA
jgi:putative oxidoreductase